MRVLCYAIIVFYLVFTSEYRKCHEGTRRNGERRKEEKQTWRENSEAVIEWIIYSWLFFFIYYLWNYLFIIIFFNAAISFCNIILSIAVVWIHLYFTDLNVVLQVRRFASYKCKIIIYIFFLIYIINLWKNII